MLFKFSDRSIIETNAKNDIAESIVIIVSAQAVAHIVHHTNIKPPAFRRLVSILAASLNTSDKLLSHYGRLIFCLMIHFIKNFSISSQHIALPLC
jgi:hypothetical protein